MNQNICMSKNYFFILFIVFIGFTIHYTLTLSKLNKIDNKIDDKILNIKQSEEPNRIIQSLPLRQLLHNRDRSVLYDPMVAPERRIDIDQYPIRIQDRINIPSRGYPDDYQLLGLLSRESDEKIVQLFGRATYSGSNQYEYYALTEQNGFVNKIPIQTKGKREIMDNDRIFIPELDKKKGDFKVKIYDYNTPRYNPYL